MENGILYLVATPIGNLEDLTLRAARLLGEVDLVAAEDTRQTLKLMSHLGLSKPMLSYYEPREEKSLAKILAALESGKSVALVTDGGTPGISDPGYRLVRAALAAGVKVVPAPGASALTAAVSVSGLPTDLVTFAGFLPAKASGRQRVLTELRDRRDTLVFFESPRRLAAFLADAAEVLGDRETVVLRELTKTFEERRSGLLSELASYYHDREVKGEVTVVVRGAGPGAAMSDDELIAVLEQELSSSCQPLSALAADLARVSGRPRKEVYALALKVRARTDAGSA